MDFSDLEFRMVSTDISTILKSLRKDSKKWPTPVVTEISYQLDPFRVLVSCILSLRTRDVNTKIASKRLFDLADTPQSILRMRAKRVEDAIRPVAFFRKKTLSLYEICRTIINCHNGRVPDTLEQLLNLKGVGRKTANPETFERCQRFPRGSILWKVNSGAIPWVDPSRGILQISDPKGQTDQNFLIVSNFGEGFDSLPVRQK